MQLDTLPPNLSTLPPVVLQGDSDGDIERAAWSLLLVDVVGAARLALTIQNPYRRAVWLKGFRQSTIAAAMQKVVPHGRRADN
jgi:hypothetical protein